MKGLDSKEIVVPSRLGTEKRKFGIKQTLIEKKKSKGQISTVKKVNEANASSLSSEMSASLSFHEILVLKFKTL